MTAGYARDLSPHTPAGQCSHKGQFSCRLVTATVLEGRGGQPRGFHWASLMSQAPFLEQQHLETLVWHFTRSCKPGQLVYQIARLSVWSLMPPALPVKGPAISTV